MKNNFEKLVDAFVDAFVEYLGAEPEMSNEEVAEKFHMSVDDVAFLRTLVKQNEEG